MEDIKLSNQSKIRLESEVKEEEVNTCHDSSEKFLEKKHSEELKPPLTVRLSEETEVCAGEEEDSCAQGKEGYDNPLLQNVKEDKLLVHGRDQYQDKQETKNLLIQDVYKAHEGLVYNNNKHMKDEAHSCSTLEMTYSTRHLTSVDETHAEGKQCSSPMLEIKSIQKVHLSSNHETHTEEKLYACPICGKIYSQKINLDHHLPTHTVHPFACSMCDKKFVTHSNLGRHLQTHRRIHPFACSMCDKKFSTLTNLGSHLQTHTSVNPFACSQCDKKFSMRKNLYAHLQTHTGDNCFRTACVKRNT